MRRYTIQPGDSLYTIACKNYYIFNDSGEPSEKRIVNVVREIIKRNPDTPALFQFALPNVFSTTIWRPKVSRWNWRNGGTGAAAVPDSATETEGSTEIKKIWHNTYQPQPAGHLPVLPPQRLPLSDSLTLPVVGGVVFYDTQQRDPTRWWYVLLWAVGILVGLVFYVFQQYLSITPDWNKRTHFFGDFLPVQLRLFMQTPTTLLLPALPGILLWSLLIVALVFYLSPARSTPARQIRARFVVTWIVGFVVLMAASPYVLTTLLPRATSSLSPFIEVLPLFVIWTTFIYLMYVYLGDGSDFHNDYLCTYSAIWTALALVVAGTALAGYIGFKQVDQRMQGELNALTVAKQTIEQLRISSRNLRDEVVLGAQKAAVVPEPTRNTVSTSSLVPPQNPEDARDDLKKQWRAIQQHTQSTLGQAREARIYVAQAIKQLEPRARQMQHEQALRQQLGLIELGSIPPLMNPGTANATVAPVRMMTLSDTSTISPSVLINLPQSQIDALESIGATLDGVITQSEQLSNAVGVTPTRDIDNLPERLQDAELLWRAQDVATKVDVAADSIGAIGVDGLPIFLWTGILYASLVLSPWVVLLLFLYRKRSNLAAQILDDLWRLDSNGRLLTRVLQGSLSRADRTILSYMIRELKTHSRQTKGSQLSIRNRFFPSFARRQADKRAAGGAQNGQTNGADAGGNSLLTYYPPDDPHYLEVVELLARRTFSAFEYLTSLLFLSLLIAVGWYYIFYPQTSIGLAYLITRGAGARDLSTFIAVNLTPLTMGFVGSYFFVIQMLVRRYLANDLYPAAFLQSAQRLVIVFILSLALTVIPFNSVANVFNGDVGAMEKGTIVCAFLLGIFPTSGLQLVIAYVNQLFRRTVFPETVVPEPLSKLPGMTIWVEARLLEENIESIQALATAQIEQLVIGTHYTTAQIVDWIDQAILYLHSGHDGEWFAQFRAVGIRGASDLLDKAGLNLTAPEKTLRNRDFKPTPRELGSLVEAIKDANASGVPRTQPDDPRGIAVNEVETLLHEVDTLGSLARQASKLMQQIVPGNSHTYDQFQRANDSMQQANAQQQTMIAQVKQNIATTNAAVQPLAGNDALKQQIKHCAALCDELLNRQLVPLPDDNVSAEDLRNTQNNLAEWRNKLTELMQQLAGVAQRGKAASIDEQLLTQTSTDQAKVFSLFEQVRDVSQDVKRLSLAQPATLDARVKLFELAQQLVQNTQTLRQSYARLRDDIQDDRLVKSAAQRQAIARATDGMNAAFDALRVQAGQVQTYAEELQKPGAGLGPDDSFARIDRAAQMLRKQIQALDEAVTTLIRPPQLSVDILTTICDAIWPDPNIPYILNFYQASIEDLRQTEEPQSVAPNTNGSVPAIARPQ